LLSPPSAGLSDLKAGTAASSVKGRPCMRETGAISAHPLLVNNFD